MRSNLRSLQSFPCYPRLIRRVRAALIDSVILTLVFFSWWLMLPLLDEFATVVRLAYPVLAFLAVEPVMVSLTGGSPGHHVMGITIRDVRTGQRIGMTRALLRFALRMLFGWLSLVLVLITERHQALHDLFCRTNVLLLDPENFPDTERFAERVTEDPDYEYPSKLRRGAVILAYIILVLLAISMTGAFVLSESCLWAAQCNRIDAIVTLLLNGTFIAGIGASIVLGWKARLIGCRRKPRTTR